MTATVRLDDSLEKKLNNLSKTLNKKKSDVIREAIEFYSNSIQDNKKSRIKNAVEKTKEIDKKEYLNLEGTISDTI
ncbi:CopG family transcriptional regulator [Halarcobacter mediterraneus]|uniref:CopG family transcriptional regulator n=1 Tax=Halarcobacter mediterraneus TaxID=2023153 RepID=A0A4Q1AWB7_9BACT|nr:ribbon-helix-helix protein, CopG family [Halarcobacter mediterraneus]RXK12302.1 CopG family transcriptional regulator [Halarcobacter mediterraneus]